MKRVAMYLRKSRADMELEKRDGKGETLAAHKRVLLDHAKKEKLNIVEIYQEIVSGESLLHRPEMMRLLDNVENFKYNAVLCMDIDRLGRGGMKEQGIILETFKEAKTKIITPMKTYDLADEWDEEYTEFQTFMSRKELKLINRRLQGGRVDSVKAGNYIGTTAPYGYTIKNLGKKNRFLVPHPEQAEVVKMIFNWYTHDDPEIRIGANMIANKLNELGYKTATGKKWASSSVLTILKNAVHAGRIQWGKTHAKKSTKDGVKRETRTLPQDEWIDVKGKHEPIVSMELYQKAQEVLKTRYHVPYQLTNGITNPLAGVIICEKCGARMVYRPYTTQKPHIKCYNNPRCNNKASNFELVERRLLESLEDWLSKYKADWDNHKKDEEGINLLEVNDSALKNLKRELKESERQKENLYDLLERGIYSEDVFLERSNLLADRIDEIKKSIKKTEKELDRQKERTKAKKKVIPEIEKVLDLYRNTDDPKQKNALIKSVLEKAVYRKEKHQWRDEFKLTIYPKLSKH